MPTPSNVRQKRYRALNPEKYREIQRRHRQTERYKATRRAFKLRYKARERELNLRRYHANHEHYKTYQREWHRKNSRKLLCTRYKITMADFDALWVKQEGKCPICLQPLPESGSSLHIDHNHQTQAVRGLVHRKCNTHILPCAEFCWPEVQRARLYLEGK